MSRPQNLGEFEQIVLLAILRLKESAYGVSIRAEIFECTGRKTTSGALYTTLERLEGKGYLSSRVGEPTPERGGRAKRYYRISASGLDPTRVRRTIATESTASTMHTRVAANAPGPT